MHTHILPGIDDGSVSMEQTRNMLMQAYEEGIRYIIATPHYGIRNPGLSMDYAEEILEEVQKEDPSRFQFDFADTSLLQAVLESLDAGGLESRDSPVHFDKTLRPVQRGAVGVHEGMAAPAKAHAFFMGSNAEGHATVLEAFFPIDERQVVKLQDGVRTRFMEA